MLKWNPCGSIWVSRVFIELVLKELYFDTSAFAIAWWGWGPDCNNTKTTTFITILIFCLLWMTQNQSNDKVERRSYLKILNLQPHTVPKRLHSPFSFREEFACNKYRDINFICNASPIYKVFMPPHHFQNPYATPFYATPQKYEILMPPLLMPPPKILMPPHLCHPQGWH